jgi:putative peptidoglycan lipid II flippase
MTTPGHQARQNAANDGVPPGTGFPPGDSVPAEEDSAYGPADGDANSVPTERYPSHHPPARQYPVHRRAPDPYPVQHLDGSQYPGAAPNPEQYPGYHPDTEHYPDHSQDGGQYPNYHPNAEQYPNYHPNAEQYPNYHPDTEQYPNYHPDTEQYPNYHPNAEQYPNYHPDTEQYPGYRPDAGQYPDTPAERYAGYRPAPDPDYRHTEAGDGGYGARGRAGRDADYGSPENLYPGYDPASDHLQGRQSPGARGRHAAERAEPPDGWGPPSSQPPEPAWRPPSSQAPEPAWVPPIPGSPAAGWDAPTTRLWQTGWEAQDTRAGEPSPEDQEDWTISLAPQGAWPAAPPWDPPTISLAPIPAREAPGKTASPATGSSVLRSSSTMAIGTLASRVTGFVRSAILIYALGTQLLGDAYNLSNTLPNIVYQFALGGIFTSVVVPLLVNAAKRDSDRGEAYDQRIFTLGVLALAAVTVVAMAAAAPITAIYAGNIGTGRAGASAYHLTLILAYFFIPQIFFYGVSSLAGAVLNARGSFASPMWTPVINNLVVIVVGLGFFAVAGPNQTPATISGGEVMLLGVGTTLGIVLQTVAMIPSLRRVGFRWRPRYDFRRAEVSEIGHMGGWMFGYVLCTQIAFLVTTRVANAAGARVGQGQHVVGAGFAAYSNAYMLFQLPYAIVGISVITAMLPRMSAHAAEGRYRRMAADFSTATRLASVVVVPAALILAVLGAPLAEGVFGYGSTSAASARYLGEIFAIFSLGLLPYMLFQQLLRVFYAMHDSRTPAYIGVVTMTVNIVANLIALAILPPAHVVAGLGAGFGVANVIGTAIAWRVLGRRIGGLDGLRIRSSLVRMHAAAIPGALFAIAVSVMVSAIISGGRLAALFTVAVGGTGALLMYVTFAKALGVPELNDLASSVRARLR